MRLETAHDTAKRLLIWSIGSIWIVAHTAFLRGIGAFHSGRLYASFGDIPGDLLGDVCQIGGIQVGIHGPRFVLHRGNRQLFIGKLRVGMLGKTLIDRPIYLLTDVPAEPLTALATGGRKLLDPLLFETLAQLRLAPPLLTITFLSLSQFAVKGAVVLARTGRDKVGNAHIHANHRD